MAQPPNDPAGPETGHAEKPSEIEDPYDIWVSRPVGSVIATAAAKLGLRPTHVTVIGGVAGMAGGALLYDRQLGWAAFALLLLHGVLDSADGQLARRTGQTSELGRVLDGVGGYVTHIAMYVGVAAGALHRGASDWVLLWMLLAGVATIVHAQLYDYYRTGYSAVVHEGHVRRNEPAKLSGFLSRLYAAYSAMQHMLVGPHLQVDSRLRARAAGGAVRDDDRQLYRASFRRLVCGWNLLGDNVRRLATGVAVLFGEPVLLFTLILVPVNLALMTLWVLQRRADRRFLSQLEVR
ncbi:MAG: CDP-alcohol phosphatidyltransferase family protein [Verrucomicrobiota bacterium]|nr:CDP-alcohol phosphatidyltransferase family protein [Verrucomicrobiota bacterium]